MRRGYRISPFGGPVTALFGTNQIRNQGLYHQGKNGSGKPRQDARRGRCHLLEAGFWSLWMRYRAIAVTSHKSLRYNSSPFRALGPFLS